MSLKSKLKHVFVITGISVAALVTAPAMAVPEINLDITGGCFSYGSAGATGCGNINAAHKEYATGSFVFTNSLSAAFDPLTDDGAFNAVANLSASNGNPADDFNSNRSQPFPTFAALTLHPLWDPASGLVFAIGDSPEMGSVATPFGTISWDNTLDAPPSSTNASGSFIFYSDDDLNGLSQLLFTRPLPLSQVTFTADARLSLVTESVPEPVTLSLLGLGLFSMVVLRRRMPG